MGNTPNLSADTNVDMTECEKLRNVANIKMNNDDFQNIYAQICHTKGELNYDKTFKETYESARTQIFKDYLRILRWLQRRSLLDNPFKISDEKLQRSLKTNTGRRFYADLVKENNADLSVAQLWERILEQHKQLGHYDAALKDEFSLDLWIKFQRSRGEKADPKGSEEGPPPKKQRG